MTTRIPAPLHTRLRARLPDRPVRRWLWPAAILLVAAAAQADPRTYTGLYGLPTEAGQLELVSASPAPQTLRYGTLTPGYVNYYDSTGFGSLGLMAVSAPEYQTLRGKAVAGSSADHGELGNTRAGFFDYRVPVTSTTLAAGTPVTLSLSFRLDGDLAAGLPSSGYPTSLPAQIYSDAEAWMGLRYTVRDVTNTMSEGDTLLDLRAYAGVSYSQHWQARELLPDGSWSSAHHEVRDQYYTVFHDSDPGNPLLDGGYHEERWMDDGRLGVVSLLFDTGVMTLTFQTYVGAMLAFDGWLETGVSMGGNTGMRALSDFSKTFDAELRSLTVGVELPGLTAGVFPVPEPGTGLLMLAGAGLLLAARRRRR